MGGSSHGTYRDKYSCKRVGKKSKPHLHPFFFLRTGIKDLHREYVWISLKCCVRNTRNQNKKLATCPIFSPELKRLQQFSGNCFLQWFSGVRHRGVLVSPGDCGLNLELPETADRKGPGRVLNTCLHLCLFVVVTSFLMHFSLWSTLVTGLQ